MPLAPLTCTAGQAELVHSREYLATARRDIQSGSEFLSTGDTNVCKDSWDIACLAAGGVIAAVDAVLHGEVQRAFCAVRPPGHHAAPQYGMGFCVLGNIAIGARYAQRQHGIGKVLIVDWDVHHGNGTQDTFYEDDSVLFFSTHQHPWYPGTGMREETGTGRGLGTTLNEPLPAGSGAREILAAVQDRLLPAVRTFRPELVLISAGFDSRVGDPLGQFLLEDDDFAQLTTIMLQIAGEFADGRLISVLEGGYSLEGVACGVAAHVRALLESSAD
jgi:acetoin utilization deacetylase AcuC-like enzyme